MADNIKICPLGGLDEKGRDCYVIEINDDIFVLDCGTVIPDRTIPGIDYLLPNYEYLVNNKNRLKGYFISHGHDENMGGLKYFYHLAPAPIYCSHGTRVVIEEQARNIGINTKFDFVEVNASDEFTVANRNIIFFQTAHNCFYSSGIAIYTDRGYIVYTGDFIVDYSLKHQAFKFDLQQVSKLAEKEILILLAESKSADKPGYCSPKHEATSLIEKSFKLDKRLFINCFSQNFFRIYEIADLCRKYNKKLYFYDKYTERNFKTVLNVEPTLFNLSDVINSSDLLRVRNNECVILMLGNGGNIYTEISKIVAGTNDDKRIKLTENDIFINCALATPTLETLATRSIDSIYKTDADVIWIKGKDLTAMHARQDDLKFFLSAFKPKYFLPVRGTFVNMMANAKMSLGTGINLNHANVFIIDNGMQIVFDQNPRPTIIPNEVNKINIAPIIVDGKGISSIGEEVIEDRKRLARDGVVIVAGAVSTKEKKIIAGPDTQMRGFVFVKEAEPLLKAITNIFVDEVKLALASNVTNFEKTEELIKDKIKKYIKRENGRDPLVHPIIINKDN